MKVVIGTNSFVDCAHLVKLKNQPLLDVQINPLRVTIVTPSDIPSKRVVQVQDNIPTPSLLDDESHVQVVAGDKNVSVLWDNFLLAVATLSSPDTVHVHVDLRPIGINMYDDATGLHVGGMHMATSSFVGAEIAFNLG